MKFISSKIDFIVSLDWLLSILVNLTTQFTERDNIGCIVYVSNLVRLRNLFAFQINVIYFIYFKDE